MSKGSFRVHARGIGNESVCGSVLPCSANNGGFMITVFRLLIVVFILSGVFVGEDPPKPESKPLPNDSKITVLEAKSALDDAQAARKDLEAQIANLNNQVKERYA